jgi:hypothetical protein
MATERKGTALMHMGHSGTQRILHTKNTGKTLTVPVMGTGPQHTLNGHERLTCESCHAAWAPQCYGCHIGFDPTRSQWDHVQQRETPGLWKETRWKIVNGPPALGVDETDGSIAPFVPGMNLIADLPGQKSLRVNRYARISPHTTQTKGRTCVECHQSPGAVGLVTGRARSLDHPEWSTPVGWIRDPSKPAPGLRPGERSFSPSEIQRVLTVGTCLPCHESGNKLYQDFPAALLAAAKLKDAPHRTKSP